MSSNRPSPGTPRLRLRVSPAAEARLRSGHPWLFAESVRAQNRPGVTGELAVIYDRRDRFLAVGLFDAGSPLRVRVLHSGRPVTLDAAWWRTRLTAARERRRDLFDARTNGWRWIHGESDGWPGLVLDRYAGTLVVKLYTAAWLPRLSEVSALIRELLQPDRLVLRLSRNIQDAARREFQLTDGQWLFAGTAQSDGDRTRPARGRRRLGDDAEPQTDAPENSAPGSQQTKCSAGRRTPQAGGLRSPFQHHPSGLSEALEAFPQFLETGLRFEADVQRGQKTGFFLDQRDNRRRIEALAQGRDVLNAFSFSGGFSLYAARGGAGSVTDLDISGHALEAGRRNFALNQDDPAVARCQRETVQADAFAWLEQNAARTFDLVILDPPSLAKREAERAGGIAAYERLASGGLRALRPGGVLVAASCSAHVSAAEFFAAVRRAADRGGRRFTELQTTGHPPDHPATFAEAEYLKCIYLQF